MTLIPGYQRQGLEDYNCTCKNRNLHVGPAPCKQHIRPSPPNGPVCCFRRPHSGRRGPRFSALLPSVGLTLERLWPSADKKTGAHSVILERPWEAGTTPRYPVDSSCARAAPGFTQSLGTECRGRGAQQAPLWIELLARGRGGGFPCAHLNCDP